MTIHTKLKNEFDNKSCGQSGSNFSFEDEKDIFDIISRVGMQKPSQAFVVQ